MSWILAGAGVGVSNWLVAASSAKTVQVQLYTVPILPITLYPRTTLGYWVLGVGYLSSY